MQVDLDLKYRTNIRHLFQQFDRFPPGAVLGISREMQPVYRYALSLRSTTTYSTTSIDVWSPLSSSDGSNEQMQLFLVDAVLSHVVLL